MVFVSYVNGAVKSDEVLINETTPAINIQNRKNSFQQIFLHKSENFDRWIEYGYGIHKHLYS